MSLKQLFTTLIADGGILHTFVRGTKDQTVTTDGGPIPTLAKIVDGAGTTIINAVSATSSNALAVSTGPKVLTIQANKGFKPGQWVTIGNGANSMSGVILSYENTTLSVNVTKVVGSGNFSSWNISLSGAAAVDGKSAYQLDVDSGNFNGTLEEWLAQIRGSNIRPIVTKFPWET